jgi:membrane-associated phospholipid phosphatase
MSLDEARSVGKGLPWNTSTSSHGSAVKRGRLSRRVRSAVVLALVVAMVSTGCRSPVREGSNASAEDRSPTAAWRTWVLDSPRSFVVPPPPAPGSGESKVDRSRLERLTQDPSIKFDASVESWIGGSPVERWIGLNLQLVSAGSLDPPSAARGYALTSVAMYDAVVAAWRWKYRYRREGPRVEQSLARPGGYPSYPSEHAAIAGAASRVLAYLFPERAAATFDQMAERAARARVVAGANYPSDVEAGLALGREVAAAVIARARADGSDRQWEGIRPHGRQFWRPAPGSDAYAVEPLAGTWMTWIPRSNRVFEVPPPPPYRTTQFIAEAREVMRLRTSLTLEQKRIAKFWEGGVGTPLPPGVWNEVAMAYARRDRLDVPMTAQLFALLNIAMADAGIATWDTKYRYWYPRPETAIKDLGLDLNWRPFLATPPFPSYVSAHSAFSAAAAAILAHCFPSDAERFQAKAEEAGVSRLYGGIHFRSDHEVGLALGRRIGRLVIAQAESECEGSRP